MREIFTYGSVGRAPGNRCLYPEPDGKKPLPVTGGVRPKAMKETKTMIRPFNEADLHNLHRMICETIDASYSGVYPPRAIRFFKEHHSEKKIVGRSVMGKILVLISERDASILATGSLMDSEIIGVFVHPDHQRQGYGKVIMAELEKMAIAESVSEITLSISLPSRKFYEYCGYDALDEYALDVGSGEYLRYWLGKKVLQP